MSRANIAQTHFKFDSGNNFKHHSMRYCINLEMVASWQNRKAAERFLISGYSICRGFSLDPGRRKCSVISVPK